MRRALSNDRLPRIPVSRPRIWARCPRSLGVGPRSNPHTDIVHFQCLDRPLRKSVTLRKKEIFRVRPPDMNPVRTSLDRTHDLGGWSRTDSPRELSQNRRHAPTALLWTAKLVPSGLPELGSNNSIWPPMPTSFGPVGVHREPIAKMIPSIRLTPSWPNLACLDGLSGFAISPSLFQLQNPLPQVIFTTGNRPTLRNKRTRHCIFPSWR